MNRAAPILDCGWPTIDGWSDLGIVGLLVSHQSTLSDVLDTMVRYRKPAQRGRWCLHVEEGARTSRVVKEELVVDFDAPKTQSYELAVGNLVTPLSFCAWSPGGRPVSAHFTHGAPKARGRFHRRIFWRSHRV